MLEYAPDADCEFGRIGTLRDQPFQVVCPVRCHAIGGFGTVAQPFNGLACEALQERRQLVDVMRAA
ncbi:MAG: hypothetical protein AMXMBFR58_24480 [Phycisphaerae bacterium]